jgi:hypothetical protein
MGKERLTEEDLGRSLEGVVSTIEGVASCSNETRSDQTVRRWGTYESFYIDFVGYRLRVLLLVFVLYPQCLPRAILDVLTKVMVTATGTLDFFALDLIVTSTSSLAALFRDTCTSSVDIIWMRG